MDITFSDLEEALPIIEEDDSLFYEHIDAPKYVDFSAPDSPPIDDRSWFCLRFGCDQQHEEFELNPEVLHRDFMLRVMAARSPNVKRWRSFNKHHQSPGSIKKCPYSAPAKSVKCGTVGTNSTSFIPKYSNSRLKTHPVSSLNSTPSTKEEKMETLISEKKGLMSPRSKGLPTKPVPSKSAKIGNGKVESLNHKGATKASCRSSSISNHGDICDGMRNVKFEDDKENACTTKCRKISMANSESSENSQQKGNKAPIKKFKELGTLKGKVKRSTNPKPFRLRTDERRIVKEANAERKIQVQSKKEILPTLRHGEFKNERRIVKETNAERKIQVKSQKENLPTLRHGEIKNERRIVKEANKENLPTLRHGDIENRCIINGKQHKTILEGPNDDKSRFIINGKQHKSILEGPKDDKSRFIINGKQHKSILEGPKDDKSERSMVKEANTKGKIQLKTQKKIPRSLKQNGDVNNERLMVRGANTESKIQLKTQKKVPTSVKQNGDVNNERLMVKEANTENKIQLKTHKKVPTSLKHNVDVKNQNAINGKTHKTILEVPKAKPNLPKAPRVRYVESRFAKKGSPNIHKLQPETKETKVIQNKVIKTGSSIPHTQRVSNVRKTVISQAEAVERNSTMADAACLKGKSQSATNREAKIPNSSVRGWIVQGFIHR